MKAKKHNVIGYYESKDIDHTLAGKENDLVYATDTKEIFQHRNGKWEHYASDVKVEGGGLNMGLYELNKSIIGQLPTITDVSEKETLINEFHHDTHNKFYMMYGKEISYFTIFNVIEGTTELKSLADGVFACLEQFGPIKAIDKNEDGTAIEIWVMDEVMTKEATCLYLFPYDAGIVEVED